jgi:hypothetical protein
MRLGQEKLWCPSMVFAYQGLQRGISTFPEHSKFFAPVDEVEPEDKTKPPVIACWGLVLD